MNRTSAGGRRRRPLLTLGSAILAVAVVVVCGVTFSNDARPSSSPSGESMPVGDLDGWRQTFTDDFSQNVQQGAFPGPYADDWLSYNGFADTSGNGLYDQSIISAHDSVLDLHVQTIGGTRRGAAPVPLVDHRWGGQKYGRFTVRMRSDRVDGYGLAFLLWSDRNDWNDGEVDFPEGALGSIPSANNHCIGDPQTTCLSVVTGAAMTSWHTYTIDWKPNSLVFLLDGRTVASTTHDVPAKTMHWVMQVGSHGKDDPSASGHLLIDWAAVYAYDPSVKASSES
jgi:hypothetical protein